VIRENGSTTLQETQLKIELKRDFLQIDVLVPFHALSYAPHRSCLPCSSPVCQRSIKLFFLPKEGLNTGEVVRSENWQGEEIKYLSAHGDKIHTSNLERERARLGFADLIAADVTLMINRAGHRHMRD
jgi:hypothetical protein